MEIVKKDEHGQNIKYDDYIGNLTSKYEFFNVMKDVFLEVLFQHTMPGEDYKASIKFSRHKILHGENFRNGRKDYVMIWFHDFRFFTWIKFGKLNIVVIN